jgi:alkanesulfonate monooxygenase SsuD/methylene tetrahydromethanopterin reductase-like flavin-dependent oxidoreductase (luciferase family)
VDDTLEQRNLIGTPEDIIERVAVYEEAGVDTLAGLLFATNEVQETIDAMSEFSERVMARFASPSGIGGEVENG